MKLRQLEMKLQKVEGFLSPRPELEQYITPAQLAARLIFHANLNGDIFGKTICDLGCGTGMLSIGAALLGGKVTGVDLDLAALKIAEKNSTLFGTNITFLEAAVNEKLTLSADTVIMNPPFGAQKEHADRPFIDAGLTIAPEVYGIFNKGSIPFIESYIKGRAEVLEKFSASLVIPKQFFFHTKDKTEISVEVLHLQRTNEDS